MSLTPEDQRGIESDLRRYDELLPEYQRHIAELTDRLTAAIGADDRIHLHAIEPRVKTRESVANKLRDKLETDPQTRIDDVLGVRIITYFRDDAIWVEQIVRDMLRCRRAAMRTRPRCWKTRSSAIGRSSSSRTMPWAMDDERLPTIIRDRRKPPPLSPARGRDPDPQHPGARVGGDRARPRLQERAPASLVPSGGGSHSPPRSSRTPTSSSR